VRQPQLPLEIVEFELLLSICACVNTRVRVRESHAGSLTVPPCRPRNQGHVCCHQQFVLVLFSIALDIALTLSSDNVTDKLVSAVVTQQLFCSARIPSDQQPLTVPAS
jgi:hypothetical protein